MNKGKKISEKQLRFIDEYLVDLNGTGAAIRAGYSKKTARQMASRMLTIPYIQNEIKKRQKEISERFECTQERIAEELMRVAFANQADFSEWGPSGVVLKDSKELSRRQSAAVAEVGQTVTQHGGSMRIKLHDKAKALELLGKRLGMFDDRVQHSGEITYKIQLPEDIEAAAVSAGADE